MGTSGTTTPPASGGGKAAAPAQPKNTYQVYLRPYGEPPNPGAPSAHVVTVQGDSVEAKNVGTSLYWSITGGAGADFEWDVVAYIVGTVNPPPAA